MRCGRSAGSFDYEYDGDRLISLTASSAAQHDTVTFTHDVLGRMTFDGMTGQSMTYNDLDLIGNIVRNDTTLVNYSYLSDGTKLSALDGSGAGLVYRGPFVYRKSSGGNAGSSLTLESAAFGARQYSPALRRWMAPDPLSEKYYGISPYAFCNNNPVNLVDPDGRYIDKGSRREWNNNKRILQKKIKGLEHQVSMLEGVENSSAIVDALNQQIAGIKQTLSIMKVLKQSTQGYKLSASNSPLGQVRLDTESGLIEIEYISEDIGNFVHEVTHAGQYESGDIGFSVTTGKVLAQDIYDEVEAYKAQACYVGVDPKMFTKQYVQNMPDASGNRIYAPFGSGRVSPLKVTVRSPLHHVHAAYGLSPTQSILPFYRAVPMLYK